MAFLVPEQEPRLDPDTAYAEVRRLRQEIADFDREAQRLDGLIARTGSPTHRLALMANKVARQCTEQAMKAWLIGFD